MENEVGWRRHARGGRSGLRFSDDVRQKKPKLHSLLESDGYVLVGVPVYIVVSMSVRAHMNAGEQVGVCASA